NEIAMVYRDLRLALKRAQTERGIETLQKHYDKQNADVEKKQQEVNRLREEHKISDIGDSTYAGQGQTLEPQTVQRLEAQRVESLADYTQINSLYKNLTNLSKADFRKAVLTAAPDQQLGSLMDHLAESEVRLASMESDLSDTHPDLIKMRQIV